MKEEGKRQLANMSQPPAIPSFTPVNYDHAPAPFEFISPLNTRHDRALDSDTFYDFRPDETTPSNAPGITTTSAAGFNGHFLPITSLSIDHKTRPRSYQTQDPWLGEPAKKRLKSTYSNRSKSAKAPPNHDWNENLDQGEILVDTEETSGDILGNPAIQLPSPPVSGRKLSKGSAPSKSVKKGNKMGPFKNPTITKPRTTSKLEVSKKEEIPITRPVINHLGWTTTQEAVKLSKTTLDRLAAFRYRSVAEEELVKSVATNRHIHEEPDHFPVEGEDQEMSNQLDDLSYHDNPGHAVNETEAKEDSNTLDETGWHSPTHHEPFSVPSKIEHHQTQSANSTQLVQSSHRRPESGSELNDPNVLGGDKSMQITQDLLVELPPQFDVDMTAQIPSSSDYGNPTSIALASLEAIIETARRAEAFMDPGISHSSSYDHITSSEARVLDTTGTAHRSEQEAIQVPDPFSIAESANVQNMSTAHESHMQNHIQVSSSQPQNEADAISEPHETVMEDPGHDDFDDDIDDEDLLRMESISIAPGNNVVASAGHKNSEVDDTPQNKLKNLPDLSHSANPDPDDEYPMDEGEEEDMLNLQEYETGIVENCDVPPSLNYGEHEDPTSGEVFDRSLQYSPPRSRASISLEKTGRLATDQNSDNPALPRLNHSSTTNIEDDEEADWTFIRSNDSRSTAPRSAIGSQPRTPAISPVKSQQSRPPATQEIDQNLTKKKSQQSQEVVDSTQLVKYAYILDDSREYEPLQPFARPDFPSLIRDRSPIVGLSTQTFLRVCFRVGELFKEGGRCDALNQNAVIELFARVTFSSREPGTTKQHFQFADLWHDRPPYPSGVLANYKSSGLAETESRVFVGARESIMARCLGTLKRQTKGASWILHIVSIRETDWEEIRWTKRIVSAGLVKTEH